MKLGKNQNVKIVGCGTGMSGEKKTPFYTIEFENAEGESIEAIRYLSDLAKERSLKTLVELGFQGKRLSDLSDPKKAVSDLFAKLDEEISITIKEEQIIKDGVEQFNEKDGTPKMRRIVEWINVGEGGGISKFDHATAVKSFNSLTFDSEIQNLRKKTGAKAPAKEKVKEETKTSDNDYTISNDGIDSDDVPF